MYEKFRKLVLVGPVPDVEQLALILGFRVSTLPMTYLGRPLQAKFNVMLRSIDSHFAVIQVMQIFNCSCIRNKSPGKFSFAATLECIRNKSPAVD